MNTVLAAWNNTDQAAALEPMLACCGARRWAQTMVKHRPYSGIEALSLTADRVWSTMEEEDWLEAFACHPRIGEHETRKAVTQPAAWSQQEQSLAATAESQVLSDLAAGNLLYEQRFGFTYIVCATGKSAGEMLGILRRRLSIDRASELHEAAEQQRQIMQIRLVKWLVA
jgi:2-oxo-4-hydroxy-4-carboxy-5-ureidoimidazoline decarboxylase